MALNQPGSDPGSTAGSFGGLCFNAHDVPPGANFCPECGAPTPNSARARAWPTDPPPYQEPPKQQQATAYPPPYGAGWRGAGWRGAGWQRAHSSPYWVPPGPPRSAYYGYPWYWWSSRYGRPINGLAIASLVLSLLWLGWMGSAMAVIFGHLALGQIRRRRQRGFGLAMTGLVIGYFSLAVLVLMAMGHATWYGF